MDILIFAIIEALAVLTAMTIKGVIKNSDLSD